MPEEPLDRRIERLERENRWWRGGLIAALVFMGLMILGGLMILAAGGHHRRRTDAVVTVPPWALRMPTGVMVPLHILHHVAEPSVAACVQVRDHKLRSPHRDS